MTRPSHGRRLVAPATHPCPAPQGGAAPATPGAARRTPRRRSVRLRRGAPAPEPRQAPAGVPERRGLSHAEVLRLTGAAAHGDAAARERLVVANLNLVRHVLRRYRAMGHDGDELFQVGCIGLIKAVDRFDPRRGTRFSTYAVPLILGEIQRHLRDSAPAGLGRGTHRLARSARAAEEALAKGLERLPTAAEVAGALGVSVAELSVALEAARRPASLDEHAANPGAEGPALYERLASTRGQEWDWAAVRALVDSLPERQRQVVLLRYFRDRSQSEIGALLGLSQPQISRLEKRAIETLRRQWQEGG